MKHPYSGLAPQHFWTKAVSPLPYADIDFLPDPKFTLQDCVKIATAGSCFAQNIAKHLRKTGSSYFDAEPMHPLQSQDYASHNGYGMFSARFGNIYTVRQLVELMEQAFGQRDTIYDIWEDNGLAYDLLRPSVQASGFSCREEAIADRTYHLTRVKKMFYECDVFIFTLGLTESWIHGEKGYVYPSCPGTSRGHYLPEMHIFKNFTYEECRADLDKALNLLTTVNPGCKVILTVSPVALAATYEKNNVLVSTSYSKSVLRAVCGDTERRFEQVLYFPSYEIISSACSFGQYLGDDLREASARGVSHVMECFSRALYPQGLEKQPPFHVAAPSLVAQDTIALAAKLLQAECDEMFNNPDAKR